MKAPPVIASFVVLLLAARIAHAEHDAAVASRIKRTLAEVERPARAGADGGAGKLTIFSPFRAKIFLTINKCRLLYPSANKRARRKRVVLPGSECEPTFDVKCEWSVFVRVGRAVDL
jgi:hypothetical protein